MYNFKNSVDNFIISCKKNVDFCLTNNSTKGSIFAKFRGKSIMN